MASEQWQQLKEQKRKLLDEIKEKARDVFKDVIDPLFEKYPQLHAVGWTQYTPYFNDGDTCEFSSSAHDADIAFGGIYSEYSNGIDAEDLEGDWKGEYEDGATRPDGFDQCEEEVHKALRIFDDDDYLGMFGDHVRVVCLRGQKPKVTPYGHD